MAKFTAAKIKEQIKKIQQAIEEEKSRYQDQNLTFVALTRRISRRSSSA